MNGLDSPLEAALALTPVNLSPLFTVVFNNIWAFLTVVTSAMITIWHLRPSVTKTVVTQHVTEVLHETVAQQSLISNVTNEEVVQEEEEEEDVVLTRGNSKKFFNVYYEEAENEEGYCGDDVDGGNVEEEEVVIMKWKTEMETELTVEMRGGELAGWYEFQDRMVIDGSVVRLWDGCGKRKCFSPRAVTRPFGGYYRCTSL